MSVEIIIQSVNKINESSGIERLNKFTIIITRLSLKELLKNVHQQEKT